MRKAKTHFEMVPVAIAKQVGRATAGSAAGGPVLCAICETQVLLEQCKINENGEAVHDRCYVAKVAGTAPLKVVPRPRAKL